MELEPEDNSHRASVPCKYNVFLHCSTTEETEQQVVRFESAPLNILDVKMQIEEQFSIAACVQVISYEGHTLKDDTVLTSLRVRDGDTFNVKYLEKGHCSDINKVIAWMKDTVAALQQAEISKQANELLVEGMQNDYVGSLAQEYFYPWLDPVRYANKLHFVYRGGVDLLMDLHAALNQRKWSKRNSNSQFIEYCLLRAIWNFSETFPLRRAICKRNGIDKCIQSMLHYKQEDGHTFKDLIRNDESFNGPLLRETIVGGLGSLCNLSELPEYHMEIATNESALQQMTEICASSYMSIESSHCVATTFLCLAHTPDTHPLLSNPGYLRKLLDAASNNLGSPDALLLLRYYVMLFLAQVCLRSPQCIPTDMYQEITTEISLLLGDTCYETVRQVELELSYLWCTYMPYIKLAYIPNTPPESNSAIYRLQLWSLDLIIFALQNMLGRENHREFLVKEELLDFVLCIPQHVPPVPSLQLRATKLVQIVTSSPDILQSPPKLLNIVKARLAKMHFGLENVLSMSISEIVSKVTNS